MKLLERFLRRSRDSSSTSLEASPSFPHSVSAEAGRVHRYDTLSKSISTESKSVVQKNPALDPVSTEAIPNDGSTDSIPKKTGAALRDSILTYSTPSEAGSGLHYDPFAHQDEIRLIILHPRLRADGFSSPISCSLVHVRLDHIPSYDALSYVWGSEQNTDVVYVNNSAHLVGKNLFLALQHLRLENEDRFLWTDALCINQLDDKERSHQVSQMGVIYSLAAVVRIWLGLSEQFTEATFAIISDIYHAYQNSHHFDNDTKHELISLCSRPYWTRLWVIQEVVLASKIEIHCGNLQIPWEPFATAFVENTEALDELYDSGVAKLCRQRLAAKKKMSSHNNRISLLFLMHTHDRAQCADVRDKIYGLHSFAPECCRSAVPVDYSCSAYELCRRLIEHEIVHHEPRGTSMSHSYRLHQMVIRGAIQQQNSRMSFDIGSISADYSRTLDHKASTGTARVQAKETGTVIWISPPINQIWKYGQDLEIPTDMYSIARLEDSLKEYPVQNILQNYASRIAQTMEPIGWGMRGCTCQMTVLPRHGGSIESKRLRALRHFILSVQKETESEDCFLAIGRLVGGLKYLFHTQARMKVGNSVLGFYGTDVFAVVDDETNLIVGRAVLLDQTLPAAFLRFDGYGLRDLNMNPSTILALSQVLI